MKNQTKLIFYSIILALILTSCSVSTDDINNYKPKNSSIAVTPFVFNWEDPNLNWMPYPSGSGIASITVPWTGPGSLYSTVDPDVLNDRKAADGWVLLYNTFSPTTLVYNPYFILYNKYRGLMRVFIYLNSGVTSTASTYLTNGITLANGSSSMLNFASTDVVDVSQNKWRVDKIEAAPKDGSLPLGLYKWYMLQYEIAYDPTVVPTTSSNPPQFSFYLNSINIQNVNLGGEVKGSLNGTIGSASNSSNNLFSSVENNLAKPLGTIGVAAIGTQFFAKNKISDTQNSLGIPNSVFTSISKGLSGALEAATGNIPGGIINILSGIFGGSSATSGTTPQTVSLDLDASLSLAGSITSGTSFPSSPTSMYYPGSIASLSNGSYNVQGYVPLYNQTLGVYNLQNKPIINKQIKITNGSNCQYLYSTNYTLNTSTVVLQWNPSVTNIANISNITYELIVDPDPLNTISTYSTVAKKENYSNHQLYSIKSNNLNITYVDYDDPYTTISEKAIYLRISFNVTPKNGGPVSAIVKTFSVNVNNLTTIKSYTYPKAGCAL